MKGKIPQSVQSVCDAYCQALADQLPGGVSGVYVYGSVALDDYQPGVSDIDLVVVISQALTEPDLVRLKGLHRQLERSFPGKNLGCIYVEPRYLGLGREEMPAVVYYHEGKLRQGFFEINPVSWYELQHFGLVLSGPAIGDLGLEISMEQVQRYVIGNVNSYWQPWVQRAAETFSPRLIESLFSRQWVSWGVLGVARQLVTLRESRVVSKTEAGAYAMNELPEWANIIQEALSARTGDRSSRYFNPFARRRDFLGCMHHLIRLCNESHIG